MHRIFAVLLVVGGCRTHAVPEDAPPPASSRPSASSRPAPPPVLAVDVVAPDDLGVLLDQLAEDDEPRVGAIVGLVLDSTSDEPLPGTTVIVTSESLPTTQAAITEEDGTYLVDDLPPGAYAVTFYYADNTFERSAVVDDAPVDVSLRFDSWAAPQRVIVTTAEPAIEEPLGFHCGGSDMNNRYFVDEIDITGLTFGTADLTED